MRAAPPAILIALAASAATAHTVNVNSGQTLAEPDLIAGIFNGQAFNLSPSTTININDDATLSPIGLYVPMQFTTPVTPPIIQPFSLVGATLNINNGGTFLSQPHDEGLGATAVSSAIINVNPGGTVADAPLYAFAGTTINNNGGDIQSRVTLENGALLIANDGYTATTTIAPGGYAEVNGGDSNGFIVDAAAILTTTGGAVSGIAASGEITTGFFVPAYLFLDGGTINYSSIAHTHAFITDGSFTDSFEIDAHPVAYASRVEISGGNFTGPLSVRSETNDDHQDPYTGAETTVDVTGGLFSLPIDVYGNSVLTVDGPVSLPRINLWEGPAVFLKDGHVDILFARSHGENWPTIGINGATVGNPASFATFLDGARVELTAGRVLNSLFLRPASGSDGTPPAVIMSGGTIEQTLRLTGSALGGTISVSGGAINGGLYFIGTTTPTPDRFPAFSVTGGEINGTITLTGHIKADFCVLRASIDGETILLPRHAPITIDEREGQELQLILADNSPFSVTLNPDDPDDNPDTADDIVQTTVTLTVKRATQCSGDTNNDGHVGPDDLFRVLNNFGRTVNGGPYDGDIDDSLRVDDDDLFAVLSRFGTTC